METHYSTAAEQPEIRNKLASLQSLKTIIEDLTLRLQHARTEYKKLETEIKTYRASVSPIKKCPEEVLLIIFDATTEQNPILATHLLTVCHRWYDIVVRAPILWNHISVKLGGKSAISTDPNMVTQHITTCLGRSGSLPLHIRLDLEDLPMVRRGEIFTHAPGVLDAISVVIGDESQHMNRWETAEIIFPRCYGEPDDEDRYENECSIYEPMWRLLCAPSPNLTKLWIKNADFFRDVSLEEPFTSFLGMRLLTELKINANPSHWDFLGLNFESVRVLQLDADIRSHQQMLELSRFIHLRHLSIYCDKRFTVPQSTPATVHLPSLQTLSLRHYSLSQKATVWNVPVLQMLTISEYVESLSVAEFPSVQALHVCWETYTWYQTLFAFHVRHHLQRLISHYTKMRKLTIPSMVRSNWESLADELSKEPGSRLVEVEFLEEEEGEMHLLSFP